MCNLGFWGCKVELSVPGSRPGSYSSEDDRVWQEGRHLGGVTELPSGSFLDAHTGEGV